MTGSCSTITAEIVGEYLANLAEHRQRLRRAAEASGGRMLHTLSSDEVEAEMSAALAAGVIKR